MLHVLSLTIALVVSICCGEYTELVVSQLDDDLTYLTTIFESTQENTRTVAEKLRTYVANVIQTQDEQVAVIDRLKHAVVEVSQLAMVVEGLQTLLGDMDNMVSVSSGFTGSVRAGYQTAARIEDIEDTAKVMLEQVEVLSAELHAASKIVEDDLLVKRQCFEASGEEQRLRVCNVVETSVSENCAQLYKLGYREDGVFTTRLGTRFVETLCDMTSDHGGWNVILQTRSRLIVSHEHSSSISPLLHFLGNVHGDFWWGLHNILSLVSHKDFELAVKVAGDEVTLFSDLFVVSQEGNHYIIRLEQGDKTTRRKLIIEEGGLKVVQTEDDASNVKQTVCPNAITHIFYLGSETVTLDVTCLMIAFAGEHVNATDVVIKVRPKFP